MNAARPRVAGGVTSIAASVVLSKPVILPTYTTIYDKLDPGDTAAIRTWRDTLGRRNYLEIEIDTDRGITARWSLDTRESLTIVRQAQQAEFRTDRGRQDRELTCERHVREPRPTDSVETMISRYYQFFATQRIDATQPTDPGFPTIEDGYRHVVTLANVRRPGTSGTRR